jgi:hypothetical protein
VAGSNYAVMGDGEQLGVSIRVTGIPQILLYAQDDRTFVSELPTHHRSTHRTSTQHKLRKGAQAVWDVVFSEIMATVDAEQICAANGAVALSAGRGDLVGALRAEVKFRLDLGFASRASRDDRHSEQEIENEADAAGHEHYDDPKEGTHRPPGRIAAHVARHERVQSGERPRRDREIDAHSDGRPAMVVARMESLYWQDVPEEILHRREGYEREADGPRRDQLHFTGEGRVALKVA